MWSLHFTHFLLKNCKNTELLFGLLDTVWHTRENPVLTCWCAYVVTIVTKWSCTIIYITFKVWGVYVLTDNNQGTPPSTAKTLHLGKCRAFPIQFLLDLNQQSSSFTPNKSNITYIMGLLTALECSTADWENEPTISVSFDNSLSEMRSFWWSCTWQRLLQLPSLHPSGGPVLV